MGVWSSIQFCRSHFYGSWIKCLSLFSTLESNAVLVKILWIVNDVFWIVLINFHDTWFYCWRWEIVIKIWVNMFKFFLRDQVINFLSYNSYFSTSFFFMSCSWVSIRWVFSWWWSIRWIQSYGSSNHTEFAFGQGQGIVDWLGPVFFCIFIFIEILWPWYMFVIVLKELFYGCLFIYVQYFSEGFFLVYHHVALAVLSHLFFKVHIQENFI